MRILKGLLLTSQNDVGQTVYVPVMQPGDIDGEVEYPDVPNTFDRVCVTIANSGSMTYQFFWKKLDKYPGTSQELNKYMDSPGCTLYHQVTQGETCFVVIISR